MWYRGFYAQRVGGDPGKPSLWDLYALSERALATASQSAPANPATGLWVQGCSTAGQLRAMVDDLLDRKDRSALVVFSFARR